MYSFFPFIYNTFHCSPRMGTSSSKSSRGHPSFPTADNKRRSSTRDSGNSFEVRKKEDVKERSDRLENKEILSYSDI